MIARYRVLPERIRAELQAIEKLVNRAKGALTRAARSPQDQDYFMASAALDLHSFYAAIERIFELTAREIDNSVPAGPRWHSDLLAQMALAIPNVRPVVISQETRAALSVYLEFRHVVRNVYTFNLRPDRVAELTRGLATVFEQTRRDLLKFTDFLVELSQADSEL